ncbi:MAG: hypothetical protein J6C84_03535 [Lachnospiraceae bacterium]|nr:hypothetical protein [Lachnospiraceae bacterium]
MYECPNCAANLKFDIARQQLYCEACETVMDPYSFQKDRDAEEYDATVFTCPQCGGTLITEDTTAATFCSYCDSSTILDSRISREKKPGYIIPFQKTKEDCRQAYRKLLRHAVFAPRALKDEAHIEKFRGIYMPFWVYDLKKEGPVSFLGFKDLRIDDYLVYRYYKIECDVYAEAKGLAYDASRSFADGLGSAIAPFDLQERKPFTPSFLSGFYADTSDVDQYEYLEEAKDIAEEENCQRFLEVGGCREYHPGEGDYRDVLSAALRPDNTEVKLAFLPVWFLSYRKGDQVAYAVVNGQTGKAAADIPVDFKKYLLASLLLAVPIFLLLNLFLVITPMNLLGIAATLATVSMVICYRQAGALRACENGDDSYRGYYKVKKGFQQVSLKRKTKEVLFAVALESIPPILIPLVFFGRLDKDAVYTLGMLAVCLGVILLPHLAVNMIGYVRGQVKEPLSEGVKGIIYNAGKSLVGIVAALIILLLRPAADEFYYFGALGCMGMVVWTIFDLIKYHNRLTLRKLPQLNRRGGDENA